MITSIENYTPRFRSHLPILQIMKDELQLFEDRTNLVASEILSYLGPVIGILGVMNELGKLKVKMSGEVVDYSRAHRSGYRGFLWGHDTTVMICTAGKVAAASAVVDMVRNHQIDLLVFSGTAAAVNANLNVGDVVISNSFIQYDVDFRPSGSPYGFPGTTKTEYSTDQTLCELSKHAAQKALTTKRDLKVCCDKGGTADRYRVTQAYLNQIKSVVACVDMESASLAQTAEDCGVPFASIRLISNLVSVHAGSEYESKANEENEKLKTEYVKCLSNDQPESSEKILFELFSLLNPLEIAAPVSVPPTLVGRKVGIMCSHEEDVQCLTRLFDRTIMTSRGNRSFYICDKEHIGVVIVKSGIGKVSSAMVATELLEGFNVEVLLNFGNATSLSAKIKPSTIVVSDYSLQYDVDVQPFRKIFVVGALGTSEFRADTRLKELFSSCVNKAVTCPIASGDRLIENTADLGPLKQLLPDPVCVDFDTGSVGQVAYQYGKPYLSVKVIVPTSAECFAKTNLDEITKSFLTFIKRIEELLFKVPL